jgi:hypothetical protein
MNINRDVYRYVDKVVGRSAKFSSDDVFYRIAYDVSTKIIKQLQTLMHFAVISGLYLCIRQLLVHH